MADVNDNVSCYIEHSILRLLARGRNFERMIPYFNMQLMFNLYLKPVK